MEEQKKHMDDLFRQQLNDYQEAPRTGMWDRIEGNLDKIDATKAPGNKKTGGSRGFMGYSIVILLLIAAAFFIYKQSSNPATADKTSLANNTTKNTDKESTPATIKTDNTQATQANTAGKTNKALASNNSSSNISTQANNNTQNNNETATTVKHSIRKVHTANRIAKHNNKPTQKNTLAHNNSVADVNNKDNSNAVDKSITTNNPAKPATATESTDISTATATTSAHSNPKQNKNASKHKEEISTAKTNIESVTPAATSPKTAAAKHIKSRPAQVKTEENNSKSVAPVLSAATTKEKKSKQHTDLANAATPKDNTRNNTDAPAKKERLNTAVKKSAPANTDVAKQDVPAAKPAVSKTNKNITPAEKKAEPVANTKKITEIPPASKPVAAKESTTSNPLKQDVETPKPELSAKENVTLNKIDSSVKDGVPDNGGSSDVASATVNTFSLQGGVKLGYEQGFSTYTTSKFVGAIYAQVALSDKLGILFQPAIKYTQLKNNIDYGSKSYYSNTGTQIARVDTISKDSLFNYHYYGTYDSIVVKTKTTTTSYIGFELPIMLKYKLSGSFSLLGGVNIDISNLFVIGDNTNTMHLRTPEDSSGILHTYEASAYFNSVKYTHPGRPYSSYVSSATQAQTTARIGYMLGLDYSIASKFTLEFLMTQSLSGYNNISDKNIKSLYSQPYFRLSIGYQLFNISKKKVPYNGGL
ncbi:MAG: hypothetical protein JSS96_02200 [Bacteroidetes bacterium]|nr:hypothetical protein [Bacteroidota bacterium]